MLQGASIANPTGLGKLYRVEYTFAPCMCTVPLVGQFLEYAQRARQNRCDQQHSDPNEVLGHVVWRLDTCRRGRRGTREGSDHDPRGDDKHREYLHTGVGLVEEQPQEHRHIEACPTRQRRITRVDRTEPPHLLIERRFGAPRGCVMQKSSY